MKNDPTPVESAGNRSKGGTPPPGASAPGLYVHVPFCKTKCPYCSFYSVVPGATPAQWLGALTREAELHRGAFGAFDTLYFGGGTPSLLGEEEIAAAVAALRGAFPFAEDLELTIEANPDDVTPGKLAAYRALGVDRVSIGVQSLSDEELHLLGRRHGARQARLAVDLAREAGFTNIGIDLIYGFDGQSLESWEEILLAALEASPEHLSCYQMTIEPSTPFGKMLEHGELRALDEESARRFFTRTSQILRSRGYIHYEISNFARGEQFISRHNYKYWRHVPNLGLGPAAHSFRDGRRWWNVRSVRDYCDALERGVSPIDGEETLTERQLLLEELSLGFRTRDGVTLETLRRFPGWQTALESLERESLVSISGGRAVPTIDGFLVADRLPLAFAGAE
jgi:putative oxygen-independent coproporphyrinogen III oxidase